MTNPQDEPYDLVVAGGRVLDPATGTDAAADIGISGDKIVALGTLSPDRYVEARTAYPPIRGTQVIDAADCLVTPGLIDLHAHVYTGVCPLTLPADEVSMSTGVTTIVSAGDAGANTMEGFRHLVVERNRTRVLAFCHISTIGLTGWPVGEARDLDFLDVDAAIRTVRANPDFVVGVKVRETLQIVGDLGLEPLRRGVAVARATDLPVMVHIGDAPVPLEEILSGFAPGDIVTHCYTGSPHGMAPDGRLVPDVHSARRRGVRFDVGHGFGSFDYEVAERAVGEGLWPDTISTDLHSLSAQGPAVDLPTTMSKFLNLGMPLNDVIEATTARPAEILGRSGTIGSLEVGRVADVAVLRLEDGEFGFSDAFGHERTGDRRLTAVATIRAGIPWAGPWPHPGRSIGALPN